MESQRTKAYLLLNTLDGKEGEILQRLRDYDYVKEATKTIGSYDMVVEIQVEEFGEIRRFVTEKVRTIPGVIETFTIIAV